RRYRQRRGRAAQAALAPLLPAALARIAVILDAEAETHVVAVPPQRHQRELVLETQPAGAEHRRGAEQRSRPPAQRRILGVPAAVDVVAEIQLVEPAIGEVVAIGPRDLGPDE